MDDPLGPYAVAVQSHVAGSASPSKYQVEHGINRSAPPICRITCKLSPTRIRSRPICAKASRRNSVRERVRRFHDRARQRSGQKAGGRFRRRRGGRLLRCARRLRLDQARYYFGIAAGRCAGFYPLPRPPHHDALRIVARVCEPGYDRDSSTTNSRPSISTLSATESSPAARSASASGK